MTRLSTGMWAGALLCASCLTAAAQQAGPYRLHNINFDLWCQEEQHLPPDRCDRRLPADDAAYQAYVSKIQSYELQYLDRKDREENFNRVILHSDPVDHPSEIPGPQENRPGPQG